MSRQLEFSRHLNGASRNNQIRDSPSQVSKPSFQKTKDDLIQAILSDVYLVVSEPDRVQTIASNLSVYDRLTLLQRFTLNVGVWTDLYLSGKRVSPLESKDQKTTVSACSSTSTSSSTSGDSSTVGDSNTNFGSWPNRSDYLHMLFEIIHLVESGQVDLGVVKNQFDFALKHFNNADINPLLLVLSVFHHQLQCRAAKNAPLGDDFVDLDGKVYNRNSLKQGPGFEDRHGNENPRYHLMTTKCGHGVKCKSLHNGQRLCTQYLLRGACDHEINHSLYDEFDNFERVCSVCPHAHLCVLCHLIQRQANDPCTNSDISPHHRPCHLQSPGEASLEAELAFKTQMYDDLMYLHCEYKTHIYKCIDNHQSSDAKFKAKCCWCHPERIDSLIAECKCNLGNRRTHTTEECYRCKLLHLFKRYPGFDHNSSPAPETITTESDEYGRFCGSPYVNLNFIRHYDLSVDITKHLQSWEYDEDNSMVYLLPGDLKCDRTEAVYYLRSNIISNRLLPGHYIPTNLCNVLLKPTDYSKRRCQATEHLDFFMKRINQRPFSSYSCRYDNKEFEPKVKYHESKGKYNSTLDPKYCLFATSFEVLQHLIPVICSMPAYRQYVTNFIQKSPLPRHRTKFGANIEPSAGFWNEKAWLAEEKRQKQKAVDDRKQREQREKEEQIRIKAEKLAERKLREQQEKEEQMRIKAEERVEQLAKQKAQINTFPTLSSSETVATISLPNNLVRRSFAQIAATAPPPSAQPVSIPMSSGVSVSILKTVRKRQIVKRQTPVERKTPVETQTSVDQNKTSVNNGKKNQRQRWSRIY